MTQVLNDGDNTYLYGLDRIAQVSTTQTGYFLPDALGSVRQVVDPQAQIQLSRSYTPFGEELSSSGSYETPFGFAGEMQDASGLLYLRARYLSTSTGRFTSVDPFSGYMNYPASMNPYQYAYNNPLRYVDPSGEVVFSLTALAGSTVLGGIVSAGFNIHQQLRENGGDWNCIDWGRVGKAALVGAVAGAISYCVLMTSAMLMVIGGSPLIPFLFTIATDLIINELSYAAELKVDGQFGSYEPSAERIIMSMIFSAIGFDFAPSSMKHSLGVAALDSADELFGGVRLRKGNPIAPMEKTLDMALNPELYAYEVAKKYGINLKGSGKPIKITYDPDIVSFGKSVKDYPDVIVLGHAAFGSEEELAITIAHELNHARSWLKGGRAPEKTANAVTKILREYIQGVR